MPEEDATEIVFGKNTKLVDPKFQRLLGQLSIEFGGLEWMIEIAIWFVADIKPETGALITPEIDFRSKLNILRELSRQRFPPGYERRRFMKFIERLHEARKIRNRRVHSVWWQKARIPDSAMSVRPGSTEDVSEEQIRREIQRLFNLSSDFAKFLKRIGALRGRSE